MADRPSPLPPGLRWCGPLLEPLFGAGVRLRVALYRLGLKRTHRAPLPVLSIGNLTVGGTGKTPMAAYLAEGLRQRGLSQQPAILMRGYGAVRTGAENDEARELARRLPGVRILCNPDRLAGARQAAASGCDLVILDDGFQHWPLARDLDLVLVDATAPWGGGHLLPRGWLREPPQALARAGAVVVTRHDQGAEGAAGRLREEIRLLAPRAVFCRARHRPLQLRRLWLGEQPRPAETLRGQTWAAACAIGNPEAFLETLRGLGADLAIARPLPDHYRYDSRGLERMLAGFLEGAQAKGRPVAGLVVTEKDAAKLEALPRPQPALAVWALGVALEVLEGEAELWERIAAALESARPRRSTRPA